MANKLAGILAVAQGIEKADLMICGIRLINVFNREIETVDISVKDGVFARVALSGEGGAYEALETVDGRGKFVIPGLIDAHTHIEMSFMSATPFAEAVLPHGTTAAIIDMHDIGNVSAECLMWLAKELAATPLKGYITIPPCIPSVPGLEDAGITMDLEELKKGMEAPGAVAVGETMDFNRVIAMEPEIMAMLSWAKEKGIYIDGHCPELTGDALQAYTAAGPMTDHEFVSLAEALEKYRLGMKVVVRRGSLTENVTAPEIINSLKDTRNVLLATDGCIVLDAIINRGTMINALREVVREGLDPTVAVQMGTINVARAYGLEKRIGAVAPGLAADMVIVDNLRDFNVEAVYVNGIKLPPPGQYRLPRYSFPDGVMNTIKLEPVKPELFQIKAPIQNGAVEAHVMGVKEDVLISDDLRLTVKVTNGEVHSDTENDILKISVIHRYRPDGGCTTGLVKGFGFSFGAIAGSIGQDSQNIVAVGVCDEDIAAAVNHLIREQGGVVYAAGGEIKGFIPLRFGGIMNHELTPQELLTRFNSFNSITREHGGAFENPAFPLSLMLTCACIPDLKITNRALVDALSGKPISLFI